MVTAWEAVTERQNKRDSGVNDNVCFFIEFVIIYTLRNTEKTPTNFISLEQGVSTSHLTH